MIIIVIKIIIITWQACHVTVSQPNLDLSTVWAKSTCRLTMNMSFCFQQWWWSYPSLFSLKYFSFFQKTVLPFFVSFVNPLVFTRWKRPPGLVMLQCHDRTLMSALFGQTRHAGWAMNMSFCFQQWWWPYPSLFFIFFILSILWSSPGGKDPLVFKGRACPKITARCCFSTASKRSMIL